MAPNNENSAKPRPRFGGGYYHQPNTIHARAMRKELTPWELQLWLRLKGKQLCGYKFRRQQPVGRYIVDFLNVEKKLIVELDGSQHVNSADDKRRDAYFRNEGYRVLRFWNNDVNANIAGVLEAILNALEDTPHQNPPLIPPASGGEVRGGDRGIRAITLDAQGEFGDILCTNGGVSSTQTAGVLSMQGQEVFRHGVEKMAAVTLETVKKAGLNMRDVNWLVGHQANARMLKMIARALKMSDSQCIVTVDQHANTSAASIPLALDAAVSQGKIKVGDIVAMPALGAGLTWGCAVVCW